MSAYTPTYAAWKDLPDRSTPITAASLQNMEDRVGLALINAPTTDTDNVIIPSVSGTDSIGAVNSTSFGFQLGGSPHWTVERGTKVFRIDDVGNIHFNENPLLASSLPGNFNKSIADMLSPTHGRLVTSVGISINCLNDPSDVTLRRAGPVGGYPYGYGSKAPLVGDNTVFTGNEVGTPSGQFRCGSFNVPFNGNGNTRNSSGTNDYAWMQGMTSERNRLMTAESAAAVGGQLRFFVTPTGSGRANTYGLQLAHNTNLQVGRSQIDSGDIGSQLQVRGDVGINETWRIGLTNTTLASGVLTSNGTNVSDGDTVTINLQKYIFKNTQIAGSVTVTNGSKSVSGNGTAFLTDVRVGASVRVVGDDTAWIVASVTNDTSLTLVKAYVDEGNAGSGKTLCSAGKMTLPNQVQIGDTAAESLLNLSIALNANDQSGSSYYAATPYLTTLSASLDAVSTSFTIDHTENMPTLPCVFLIDSEYMLGVNLTGGTSLSVIRAASGSVAATHVSRSNVSTSTQTCLVASVGSDPANLALTVTARIRGTTPNSYATTTTAASLSWGAATLTGGTAPTSGTWKMIHYGELPVNSNSFGGLGASILESDGVTPSTATLSTTSNVVVSSTTASLWSSGTATQKLNVGEWLRFDFDNGIYQISSVDSDTQVTLTATYGSSPGGVGGTGKAFKRVGEATAAIAASATLTEIQSALEALPSIGTGTAFATSSVTATNGSNTVTGTGTSFRSDVFVNGFVRFGADALSALYKVTSVDSDTQFRLTTTYAGATTQGMTATNVAVYSNPTPDQPDGTVCWIDFCGGLRARRVITPGIVNTSLVGGQYVSNVTVEGMNSRRSFPAASFRQGGPNGSKPGSDIFQIFNISGSADGIDKVWFVDQNLAMNQAAGTILSGKMTPAALSARADDYAPTALSSASPRTVATVTKIRQATNGAAQTITGISGGSDGKVLIISNINAAGTTATLSLSGNSTNSAVGNRFLGSDIVIAAGDERWITYDSSSSGWRGRP